MGAGNVGLVLANYAHLRDPEFRVLVRMAHTALDAPNAKGQPAGVYFGGWEILAHTLNYSLPDSPGPDAPFEEVQAYRRRSKQVRKQVDRVIAALVDAGLVQRVGQAHRGRRQEYQLNLFAAIGERPPATGDLMTPAQGDLSGGMVPQASTEWPPAQGGPRRTEEPGDEDIPQDTSTPVSASTPDRARGHTTARPAGGIDEEGAAVGVHWVGGHPFNAAARSTGCRLCGLSADDERHQAVKTG